MNDSEGSYSVIVPDLTAMKASEGAQSTTPEEPLADPQAPGESDDTHFQMQIRPEELMSPPPLGEAPVDPQAELQDEDVNAGKVR